MGAGTSAEQVADKEEQAEQSNDLEQLQQDSQAVEAAEDVKLLHKNGKIAILNGTSEGEETVEVIIEAEDFNGFQEEEVAKDVEQTEPAKVTLNGEQKENMEVVPSDAASKENTKEDGQAETSEINDLSPVSEEKVESPEQSNESQSSEVGFKKVFKFVGFKFTVKKDKTEKSEPVQLLTVKKDEAEVNGTTSQEEQIDAASPDKDQKEPETNDDVQQAESPNGPSPALESPVEILELEKEELQTQTNKEELDVEKDKKSPESPTNAVVTETSSPFRRFFTQGWAGLRKKTSFKKSKEEDPQEVEKHIKGEEQEKTEAPEPVKEEGGAVKEEGEAAPEPVKDESEAAPEKVEEPVPEESSKSATEEPKSTNEANAQISPEEIQADKVPSDQLQETVKADEGTVQITEEESIPEKINVAVSVSSEVEAETDTLEINPENQITDLVSPPSVEVTNESQSEVAPETKVSASEQSELCVSTESGDLEKVQEGITTEAELLSSQEKVKAQSSPLKKLFSSSGLRKLSGKKSKGKKDDDAKTDITGEPALPSSESPEAAEVDSGDSSPSSPDESAEASPTEKPVEEEPQADLEGEATSDGERKKDGITPWASFKKLVTPKRRPKRPSESDKEDEVEKVKTSTMSSTDSGGSVQNQEEAKETSEEQKLEKSTDENKKKADSSVSWDALICVGSSKKRARKTSDSDEEEVPKSQEECKKTDGEAEQTQEPESESPITSSQEQQAQESSSPDQVNSPTEGDGVSTWQSFKRLVTPRRKSKTKADEKPEETAAVSNPEQSTSEGEGSKDESWVSFKKLIPGRRKKRSDAKQEQTSPNADQPEHESAVEDSDEPAVVPLAEFDAAELEKVNAQESVAVSGPADGSGEQKESTEKHSDELVHAVTVTLIEGERAVTSLEERAPSWISAKVAETIEQEEETIKKIKTEITVEETVVLSTVSQVMAETQSTLINEVELTSEALTALEEAIETSCAEETTEMLSAVSQLGESIMSTEQATPVAEDDISVQTLQEQKQITDNILHAVAESAKLSLDVINSENVIAPPNIEDVVQETNTKQYTITLTKNAVAELVEEQKNVSTIVEEHIEEVIIKVTEKVTECVTTIQVKSDEIVSVPTLEQTNTVNDQETEYSSISAEEKIANLVSDAAFEESGEDLQNSAEVKVVEETLDSGKTEVLEEITVVSTSVSLLAEESKVDAPTTVDSGEEVHAEIGVPVSCALRATESIFVSSELQENATLASDLKHAEESAPTPAELKPKDVDPMPLEIEIHVATDRTLEEAAPVADKVEAKEGTFVPDEVRAKESDAVSFEVQAEESYVPPEVQTEEFVAEKCDAVPSEVQPEEGPHVLVEVKTQESDSMSCEMQAEKTAPVLPEVQTQETVHVTSVVEAEAAPVISAAEAEAAPVTSAVEAEEAAPVTSAVEAEEA
ncbi:A-kinase anchor protein 12, partial [Pyxicephalus adspersus]|uniref:A-kinase anchor protein 12 n=1 Tax=Pyxicephalus adspersus TaxID=30357 RepID=UPI003B5A587F